MTVRRYLSAFYEMFPRRCPPLWMKPGDVIEVEISSIGVLRNTVVAEET